MSLNSTVTLLRDWAAVHAAVRRSVAEARVLQHSVSLARDAGESRLAAVQTTRLGAAVDGICAQVPALFAILETHLRSTETSEETSEEEPSESSPMAVALGLTGSRAQAFAESARRLCSGDMARWQALARAYSAEQAAAPLELDDFLAAAETLGCAAGELLQEINDRLDALAQDRRARAAADEESRLERHARLI
ncbi:hypothetical protein H4217_001251 [Coemansia sp. RSA 1939]|nr:hypothetical protein H4217_001251 [Coemansia sp. RSA 1939]KAJ2614555.1 hypothetical protein EV177_001997 [Coemansia sp. RSA 1804]KAJ2667870.1 hypothetical protein GGH99_006553 [Coemansia sp. RSA 1285]